MSRSESEEKPGPKGKLQPRENRVVVKSSDMSEDMQAFVKDLVRDAQERYSKESDIAAHIKKEMDVKFQQAWHCIVGTKFGSFVTHSRGNFIYLVIDDYITVLLFKT